MTRQIDSELLGEDVGTASNRLKNMIMFSLIQECGRDACFKCDQKIESYGEMSVEHKKPWRRVSADLFWDLDNVAFSHRKCNTPDRPSRKVGPEGTSWCSKCKAFLAVVEFGANQSRWNGLNTHCLECDRKRVAAYASKNPRRPCPECKSRMRKKCPSCGYDMPMRDYMALRRSEGVKY